MDQSKDKMNRVRSLLEQFIQAENSITRINHENNEYECSRLREYQLIQEKVIEELVDLLSNYRGQ